MITLEQISLKTDAYLNNVISGFEFIDFIDDAVSTDAVYDYPDDVQAVIMHYQDMLALYVDDPSKRLESSAFYGPDKLRDVVSNFKLELDALI